MCLVRAIICEMVKFVRRLNETGCFIVFDKFIGQQLQGAGG